MNDIDWSLTARVIIWTVLAFFALGVLEFLAWASYVEIRKLLRALRTRREFRGHLESERRRVRLEKLVALSDEYDNAPTDKERQRIYIKASALGLTDDSEAFHLDEPEQPHPPTGRAA